MENRYEHVFVGSYAGVSEQAITWLLFDKETGSLEKLGGASGIASPSFVTVDAPRSRLFAVSETDSGEVVSYAIDWEKRTLTEMNRQPTQGMYPCHLTIDETGRWLALVNYGSGSICLYPVAESSGAIGEMADREQHEGSSVNAKRQEAPHPHSINPIPGRIGQYLVPDLGIDKLVAYRLDEAAGKLRPLAATGTSPGSGPRHAAFHPSEPIVYVIHELDNTIGVFAMGERGEGVTLRQSISTLPADFNGSSTCAEVAVSPSGRFVYGSNRGHDSIAVFRVGDGGKLEAAGHVPTQGKTPRSFTLLKDGSYLLVANQDSDSIVVMKVGGDGIPVPTGGLFATAKPVCLRTIPFPKLN